LFPPNLKIIFVYQILKLDACQIELENLENKNPQPNERLGHKKNCPYHHDKGNLKPKPKT
jgi:hypothetical protein